jgi:eukaryotic-like serine/threonine-protein kinase
MSTIPARTSTPLIVDWQRRYQVVRKLGRGGFAEVFEAWDRQLSRLVALKVIDERRGLSARVLREVQAAAALSHPNVVALYDYFADGERSYLVWELVRGEPLSALRDELDDAEAVGVMAQALAAIAHAHGQGVVHRDVKPQNIMLDEDGHAKVMDFGIARLNDTDTLTAEGDMLGTVAYMSPEQAAGHRVGPATDVYSAAVVLFELLAGVSPVRGATTAETLSNIVSGRALTLEAVRPDLPRELAYAVGVAMAPAPADRPTAAELAAELGRVLAGGQLARRRTSRALEALGRRQQLAERFGGAAVGGLCVGFLLAGLPAYPSAWTLPLAAMTAAVWALMPAAGLAFLLGSLVFPMFNVSSGAGSVYVTLAFVALFVFRRRPACAVWPAVALLLTPAYGTLLAPAGAAVLGRFRGPLTAAWAAAGTSVYLALAGHGDSPFSGFRPGVLAQRLASAGDPLVVAGRLGAFLLDPAALAQMAVWAGLATAVRWAAGLQSLALRLWVWAGAFAALFMVTALVPASLGRRVSLSSLLASVAVAAVVVILPLVTGQGGGRRIRGPIDAVLVSGAGGTKR